MGVMDSHSEFYCIPLDHAHDCGLWHDADFRCISAVSSLYPGHWWQNAAVLFFPEVDAQKQGIF